MFSYSFSNYLYHVSHRFQVPGSTKLLSIRCCSTKGRLPAKPPRFITQACIEYGSRPENILPVAVYGTGFGDPEPSFLELCRIPGHKAFMIIAPVIEYHGIWNCVASIPYMSVLVPGYWCR